MPESKHGKARSGRSRGRRAVTLTAACLLVAGVAAVALAEAGSTPRPSAAAGTSGRHRTAAPGSRSATPGAAVDSQQSTAVTGSCASSPVKYRAGSRRWPDCSDTGVPAGTKLRNVTSPRPTGQGDRYETQITRNGTVINGVSLAGSFDVAANNVTIENSRISSESWWGINLRQGYHGLKILHDTIVGVPGKGLDNGGEDYGVSAYGTGVVVEWTDVSEFGEGLSMGLGTINHDYVHNLQTFIPKGASDYEHTDDVISDGGSGLVIENSTLLNQATPRHGASASIGLYRDSANVANVAITNNYIAGGAYALYPGGTSSRRIVVTKNVFSRIFWRNSGYYGPLATPYWHSGSGNVWSDNVWADGPRAGRKIRP